MLRFSSRKSLYFLCILFVLINLALTACNQEKVYNVGIYNENITVTNRVDGVKEGLKTLGYSEGKNIRYHMLDATTMTAEQQETALKEFATKNYDLYWTPSATAAQNLKKLVGKQPIILAGNIETLKGNAVQSTQRPGSNLTGIDSITTELTANRLKWLTRYDPTIKKVYALFETKNAPQVAYMNILREEAKNLGVTLIEKPVSDRAETKNIVSTFKAEEAQAMLFVSFGLLNSVRNEVKQIVEKEKLVLVGGEASHFELGALFSYGADNFALGRQSAIYVDKVLNGEDPANLPILNAQKLELSLNQKLADQLGLKFPEVLLNSADKVVK